jgi:hypothetical protein
MFTIFYVVMRRFTSITLNLLAAYDALQKTTLSMEFSTSEVRSSPTLMEVFTEQDWSLSLGLWQFGFVQAICR